MSDADDVRATLDAINAAWRQNRPRDIEPMLDRDVVMVFPGFSGRISGRDAMIDGFIDFCANARVQSYDESAHEIDVGGDTAIASFKFDMIYERASERWRSTGRDLWVLARADGDWRAVWRTMLDVAEDPA